MSPWMQVGSIRVDGSQIVAFAPVGVDHQETPHGIGILLRGQDYAKSWHLVARFKSVERRDAACEVLDDKLTGSGDPYRGRDPETAD